jgi:methylglutaconyl-CoA hydratase
MNKPTIARVHGAAWAAAWGWLRPATSASPATGAVFATSEVKFGIIPSAISPYVIRAIGARQAGRYFRPPSGFSAAAAELGLAHEAVRPTRSMPRCRTSSTPCCRAARSPRRRPRI